MYCTNLIMLAKLLMVRSAGTKYFILSKIGKLFSDAYLSTITWEILNLLVTMYLMMYLLKKFKVNTLSCTLQPLIYLTDLTETSYKTRVSTSYLHVAVLIRGGGGGFDKGRDKELWTKLYKCIVYTINTDPSPQKWQSFWHGNFHQLWKCWTKKILFSCLLITYIFYFALRSLLKLKVIMFSNHV